MINKLTKQIKMNFKKFIGENHPDPDTLLLNNFEQMCILAEKYAESLQLSKADVSGSVCLDTKLQIKLGELMQQIESSYCYMEKNKLRNKISAICIILDINTFR